MYIYITYVLPIYYLCITYILPMYYLYYPDITYILPIYYPGSFSCTYRINWSTFFGGTIQIYTYIDIDIDNDII